MIKRHYFISARKWDQGSFTWRHMEFCTTRWIECKSSVFAEAVEMITDDLSDKPGTDVEICAFNRI